MLGPMLKIRRLLVVALLVRSPTTLRHLSVPWAMALGVAVLFVAVDLALRHGLQPALSTLAGEGTSAASLAQVAATGALAANVVNNLPAYAALESVTAALVWVSLERGSHEEPSRCVDGALVESGGGRAGREGLLSPAAKKTYDLMSPVPRL